MKETPVALVTGTRKGLGKYLAEQFLGRGYRVIGCSRGAAEWSAEGYQHVTADVGDEAQVKELFQAVRTLGRLDVTVNNAGTAAMNHSMLTPADTAERILRTNFLGSFLVARESAKWMRKRNSGRIINLSTVAVPLLLEGEAIYAASKSALETLTRIMSKELALFGITVNAIGPPPMETDLIRSVPQEKINAILERLALKHLGKLADVWNVLDFLIRPESEAVTGQVIYLGGA